MISLIGFGSINKFFWLIIASALFNLLINISFNLKYQNYISIGMFGILNMPILNDHIFIRFIYYYLGLIAFSLIFLGINYSKEKNNINFNKIKEINNENDESVQQKKGKLIYRNFIVNKASKSFPKLIFIILFFILNEMIIFYFDQKNYNVINFWVLEIFFIHFLFVKKNKLQLYKHQILAFSIIIIFSFGIKLVSSFTKQCEYPLQDPNDIDEKFREMTKNVSDKAMKIFNTTFFNNSLKQLIIDNNNYGTRACRNMYIVLILDFKFEYVILLAVFGYLLGLFLHSYSAVKFKFYIDEKYISPYSIIFFMGLIGFILNLILLFISSFIPCGRNSNYISNFCHVINYESNNINSSNDVYILQQNIILIIS